MVLNLAVFTWMGAAAPWSLIWGPNVAPFTQFLLAGFSILLLRRLPVIIALSHGVPQLALWRHALTAGFFGPMGVSAMYYLFLALNYLSSFEHPELDTTEFEEALRLVIWFCVILSIVVHGSCIGAYQAATGLVWLCRTWSAKSIFKAEHGEANSDPERQPLI